MPSNSRKKRLRFHESTQRALCRMVFLWLALVPMFGVVSYSILLATPWYQSHQNETWQRRLSDNLGVEVHFKSIEFPRPNTFRVCELVCSNAETGREILTIAQVNAYIDRSGWLVDVSSPMLNGQQIQTAMQAVHDRFLCRPQNSAGLLGLAMQDLLVSDGSATTKFQNVKVGFKPTEATSTLMVSYSLEGQNSSGLASFSVDRDHLSETTKWTINSNDISIPCNVLSERFPALKFLGDQARFRGMIDWWQKNQHWETSVRGDFQSVDLAMASMPFGKPMQGIGTLSIGNAVISDGTFREFRGLLTGDSCTVDTEWLDATSASLKLLTTAEQPWRQMGPFASVSRLGIRFALDSRGLKFTGATPPPPDQNWPLLAAYVGNKPIACDESTIVSLQALTNAQAVYSKSSNELQPARIASGRRSWP